MFYFYLRRQILWDSYLELSKNQHYEKATSCFNVCPFSFFWQNPGYGYVRSDASTQVDYSKIAKDLSNSLMDASAKRESQARALGWSSAAEMDRARRANNLRIKAEKKRRKRERKLQKIRYKRAKKHLEKDNKWGF